MTVAELIEKLSRMPEDAMVMVKHDLICEKAYIAALELHVTDNVVVLREID